MKMRLWMTIILREFKVNKNRTIIKVSHWLNKVQSQASCTFWGKRRSLSISFLWLWSGWLPPSAITWSGFRSSISQAASVSMPWFTFKIMEQYHYQTEVIILKVLYYVKWFFGHIVTFIYRNALSIRPPLHPLFPNFPEQSTRFCSLSDTNWPDFRKCCPRKSIRF